MSHDILIATINELHAVRGRLKKHLLISVAGITAWIPILWYVTFNNQELLGFLQNHPLIFLAYPLSIGTIFLFFVSIDLLMTIALASSGLIMQNPPTSRSMQPGLGAIQKMARAFAPINRLLHTTFQHFYNFISLCMGTNVKNKFITCFAISREITSKFHLSAKHFNLFTPRKQSDKPHIA